MVFSGNYRKQVDLLVRTLPHVAKENCLALKGGTAINLFVRNLPRLSVDIDLTFLPLTDRDQALLEIDTALKRIARRIQGADTNIHITGSAPSSQKSINKLLVRTRHHIQIKIEVTPVLRGCVYDPVMKPIVESAQDQFGFAEMNILSFADLYAGKIVAALDRQHPRDLFDVHQLLVLRPGYFDEFRAFQMIQDKAQFAVNGHSLHKDCNAVLDHLESSLRAGREAVVRGVTSFGKGVAITCKTCLAANGFPAR